MAAFHFSMIVSFFKTLFALLYIPPPAFWEEQTAPPHPPAL